MSSSSRRRSAKSAPSSDEDADGGEEKLSAIALARQQREIKQRRLVSSKPAPPPSSAHSLHSLGEDFYDEEVVKIDKSRAVLRVALGDASAAAPVLSREVYTADRINELKQEAAAASRSVEPPQPIAGPEALKLAQQAQVEDEAESDTSSSSYTSSSSSQSSRNSTPAPKPRRLHDTPSSIVQELASFFSTLQSREAELQATLQRLDGPGPDFSDKEAKAQTAAKRTAAVQDVILYVRGLRACLGGVLPHIQAAEFVELDLSARVPQDAVLLRAKHQGLLQAWPAVRASTNAVAEPPRASPAVDVRELFAAVHDDFSSASAVAKRFAQWSAADASSFDAAETRDALGELLAPYVRWAEACAQPGEFPSSRPSAWKGMPAGLDDVLVASVAAHAGAHILPMAIGRRPWSASSSDACQDALALACSASPAASKALVQSLCRALEASARLLCVPLATDAALVSPDVALLAVLDARLDEAVGVLRAICACADRAEAGWARLHAAGVLQTHLVPAFKQRLGTLGKGHADTLQRVRDLADLLASGFQEPIVPMEWTDTLR
jgi:predicted nucleic acid-binding Zn ribbon protein